MTGKPKIDDTTHYSECRLSKDVLTIDYHVDFECFVAAEVVQSVVTSDGEACVGQDEVMVGVDYDPLDREGKSYQRVLCAALQSPTSLNATCQNVLMATP
ncbi:hypothetical protein Pmani_001359 [Petrolisthes manimaculis]|uniref:Uncharacterized protein n=1 Tax=Petrolisthes manimaculis TaxID=1843537 RepID=A0AAE1QKS3_9EUCA|nr:hypothetical protein Pmani_001339 [Petrolisthes manimaculis]KAK4328241.1 hypothetical protein Pmani_001359 [Petrolisthes manimaculis]